MPVPLINLGEVFVMTQNLVYAMPQIQTMLMCDTGGAVFEKATKSDFVLNSSVNLTNGFSLMPGGGFIRCTSGNVSVVFSRN